MIMIIFGGCSQRDPERFYSKEHSFSIKFPAGWNAKSGYKESIVRAENPSLLPDDNFQENMNIVSDIIPAGMSIDEYFSSGKKLLKEALPDLKVEGSGTCVIDGKQSYWFTYSYSLKPIRIKVAVYNIIRKKNLFMITCTSEEKKFNTVKEIFETSAKSFRIE